MDQPESTDRIAQSLQQVARVVVVAVFGLLPILFIPSTYAPFGYSKTLLVIVGVFAAVLFVALSILRSGEVRIGVPYALIALWAVVGIAFVSALFSGDMFDALVGDAFSIHTVAFLALMAVVATLGSLFIDAKPTLMRWYMLLAGATVLLGLFHIIRLFFGADVLSFGVFTSQVSSPIGGWNDLAIFFGLSILLSIVALEQLPLPKLGQGLFSAVVVVALCMLAVINFFAIWIILGMVSLVVLAYALTKDRFRPQSELMPQATQRGTSVTAVVVAAVVFMFSVLFIIGGSVLGNTISATSGVNYIEVRPSVEATIGIAKGVFTENALFGIGPNKFSDAWRLYKDTSINTTIFWNNSFVGGSGYIPTFLITTGIFGLLAWLAFLGLFVWSGLRMLFKTTQTDRFWYFIGSSSFVAAAYLWLMSIIYVPGSTILLMAAMFTGVTFAAHAALLPRRTRLLSIAADRRAGFVLVVSVMVLIIASVATLYFTGRHYLALYGFNQAVSSQSNLQSRLNSMASAFTLSENDTFARQIALNQLTRINALVALQNPNEAQQQEFSDAVTNGVRAAQVAVNTDGTDAQNWAVLGATYSAVSAARVEGAVERAASALTEARRLDPKNPELALVEAQLLSRNGDIDGARAKAREAIALKPDYTPAMLFITQIEIASGNTAEAIAATQSMLRLEPRNPARYYQLGVLYSASGDVPSAVASFEQAVTLDQNYANARYLLALGYVEQGRPAEAIEQLTVVRDLNPDNTAVQELINQISNGTAAAVSPADLEVVSEPEPEQAEDAVSASPETVPETDLLSPVNTPPESAEAETGDEIPE